MRFLVSSFYEHFTVYWEDEAGVLKIKLMYSTKHTYE